MSLTRNSQSVTLIANIGRDPDTRFMPSGTQVTNINVATNRQYNTGKPSRGLLIRPLRHEQRDSFYVSVDNPAGGTM